MSEKTIPEKICSRCGIAKPATQKHFGRNRLGLVRSCLACKIPRSANSPKPIKTKAVCTRIALNCEECGARFTRQPSKMRTRGIYCSMACWRAHCLNPTRIAQRFFPNVDRNGPVIVPSLGPCHVWTACRSKRGYGAFGVASTSVTAPRVAFFLAHGRWPHPFACHHCDNPPCVNPDHLFEGTIADNTRDMVRKGRNVIPRVRGSRHGRSKLKEPDVLAIRAAYAAGELQRSIAARFKICRTAVSLIVNRHQWTHI